MKKIESVSEDAVQSLTEMGQQIIKETVDQSMENSDEVAHHGPEARKIIEAVFQFTHQMLFAFLHPRMKRSNFRIFSFAQMKPSTSRKNSVRISLH